MLLALAWLPCRWHGMLVALALAWLAAGFGLASLAVAWHAASLGMALFSQFQALFSKSFSSFHRGTCLLSISRPYLALDGIYCLIRAAFPNNPTRRQCLVVLQGPGTTGLSPSPAPLSRGLRPGPPLRTLLQTTIPMTGSLDFQAGRFLDQPGSIPSLRRQHCISPTDGVGTVRGRHGRSPQRATNGWWGNGGRRPRAPAQGPEYESTSMTACGPCLRHDNVRGQHETWEILWGSPSAMRWRDKYRHTIRTEFLFFG
ncbi:Protein TAR1 [Camellia lanceoleosa]|uniref:Protein TAR1 n=1 Tax=Camellia lanceoleosa TaxID=1840588 RepID=A0ACC0FT83_9ERIC|nr:Protein TAR1 [Camellia lanceoleosa]